MSLDNIATTALVAVASISGWVIAGYLVLKSAPKASSSPEIQSDDGADFYIRVDRVDDPFFDPVKDEWDIVKVLDRRMGYVKYQYTTKPNQPAKTMKETSFNHVFKPYKYPKG